jgi:multicomponent Na+:H+ antiporter subunit E
MIVATAWRLAIILTLWWALTEGDVPTGPGLAIAVATVAGATAASVALRATDGARLRLTRLPRFVAFFLWQSVGGGVDVARRALLPGGEVRPGFVEFDPGLPEGTPRALLIEVVSVMPGTLVAQQISAAGAVRVHVLDTRLPALEGLARVEREVRLLFGLE